MTNALHGSPRRLLLVIGVALVVAAASLWWIRDADERRVNAACETWLHHRGSLRNVLTESDEAVGRAQDAHAPRTGRYFNDLDGESAALREWTGESPRLMDSLGHDSGASTLERGMWSALDFVESGVEELQRLIEHRPPVEVASWLPEMSARFQNVDDVCLAAARRT